MVPRRASVSLGFIVITVFGGRKQRAIDRKGRSAVAVSYLHGHRLVPQDVRFGSRQSKASCAQSGRTGKSVRSRLAIDNPLMACYVAWETKTDEAVKQKSLRKP